MTTQQIDEARRRNDERLEEAIARPTKLLNTYWNLKYQSIKFQAIEDLQEAKAEWIKEEKRIIKFERTLNLKNGGRR